MSQIYGVISDSHNHSWNAFATASADGVNSRLQLILDETLRCATEIKARGGKTMYHAGDLFHVRGSVAPSVLNPTLDTYKQIIAMGIKIRILAGNHDLEFREANRTGSAVTALEAIGCEIVNQPTLFDDDKVAMIPWYQSVDDLKEKIQEVAEIIEKHEHSAKDEWTLIIHAPVDGVIKGLPSHGLTAPMLAAYGFKQVFSGHYHNHKDLGHNVWSIGALTHHSWSDVGSKAGFLLVDDFNVEWRKSHAPSFIEVNGDMAEEDIALAADGNYVRCTLTESDPATVERVRDFLTKSGAKGINILYQKRVVEVSREVTAKSTAAGASIETSVNDYIEALVHPHGKALSELCQSILTEARMELAK